MSCAAACPRVELPPAAFAALLVEHLPDMLCVGSGRGHWDWVSPAAERILGRSCAELTRRPWLEMVHPDDREATVACLSQLRLGLPVRGYVNRYLHADGSVRHLEWHGIWWEGHTYAVARDVTPAVDTVSTTAQAVDVGLAGGQPDMSADQFRATRAAAGLTMARTAELLGVSLRTVWRWEHGAVRIDRFKSERIRRELVPGLWAKGQRNDIMAEE